MKTYKIIISNTAKNQLIEIYQFIKKDSLVNAKKIKLRILDLISSQFFLPQKYPIEKHLNQQKGEFRFIPIYSYKIIYEVTEEQVIVLQIFHSS